MNEADLSRQVVGPINAAGAQLATLTTQVSDLQASLEDFQERWDRDAPTAAQLADLLLLGRRATQIIVNWQDGESDLTLLEPVHQPSTLQRPQATPTLIFIHGLPGAGKTELGKRLAEKSQRAIYVDTGAHPEFRERPFSDIVASEFVRTGGLNGYSLVFEGVYSDRVSRDRLVSTVASSIARVNGAQYFGCTHIFYLDTHPQVLVERRPVRTAEAYEALGRDVISGSLGHHYASLPQETDETTARVECIIGACPALARREGHF